MCSSNLYYADEYVDKKDKCNKLGIGVMMDDSIGVIRELDCKSIWFGEKLFNDHSFSNCIKCKNWKKVRRVMEKNKSIIFIKI